MCIILFALDRHPNHRLLLLANRDEFYDRPTAAAHYWDDDPHIFAGKDLVMGGTWLGVAKGEHGVRFAAVTNYRDPTAAKGRLSRGGLVADFLRRMEPPFSYLEKVKDRAGDYSGFNLIAGEIDRERSDVCYHSNRGDGVRRLGPGIYGLSNHLLDTPWPKVVRGRRRFAELLSGEQVNRSDAFEILKNATLAEDSELPDTGIGYEREKAISPIFIETETYGTRNSTFLSIGNDLNFDLEERVFV